MGKNAAAGRYCPLPGAGKNAMMGAMKKFLHTFKNISPGSLMAVRVVLILCCAMAFAGFALCLFAGEPGVRNFYTYRLAKALGDTPAGVLLLAGIGLIIVEAPR